MSIDERLKEIKVWVSYGDCHMTYGHLSEENISAIKQAFEEEGYQKPNELGQVSYSTIYKDGKTTIVPAKPDLMTGQEWFDAFEKELKKTNKPRRW